MTLQASFSGPLYQQVHESLKSKITNGEWTGGMAIPGDAELSRQLGVSIGTVRKALDELARQRLVVRERGRGTFIKDRSAWCGDMDSWLCDEAGRPIEAEIEIVSAETVVASSAERSWLQMSAPRGAQSRVHKVVRKWRYEEQVVCAERLLVDAVRLPDLRDGSALNAPVLSGFYMRKLRKGIGRTLWSIEEGGPDPDLQRLFEGVGEGMRISCRRTVCDNADIPLEICNQLIDLGRVTCRFTR